MRKTTIALFVCLTIFTTQASIISSLLKHTHLKGNANVNTTNGLDLSYNTSLGFKNKHVSIDLANLVTKFNAVKANNSNSIDYKGDVIITQDGTAMNASVQGNVGYNQGLNTTFNKKTETNETVVSSRINNVNAWSIQSGQVKAAGTSKGTLNVTITTDKKDNVYHITQDAKGLNIIDGNITYDGDTNNTFRYGRMGAALIDEVVIVNPKCVEHNHPSKLPNVTSKGNVSFYDIQGTKWNGYDSAVVRQGGAVFAGESYFNASTVTDLAKTARVVNAQKGIFAYKNQVYQNGTKLGDTYIKGIAAYAQAINSVMFDNSTIDLTAANYGGLSEVWMAVPSNKTRRNSRFVEMEQFSDHHHHHHHDHDHNEEEGGEHNHNVNKTDEQRAVQKGVLTAAYKAGLHYRTALVNDIGTRGTDVQTGLFYDIKGNDTISKKPWEIQGNRTSATHWEIAANQSQYNNIVVETNTNNNFLDKVTESNDNLRKFLE